MNTEEYLDALLAIPEVYRPMVSRDGARVAWTWFRMGPAADVFVVPTDGSSTPARLSQTPENTYLVNWSPDSSAIIVAEDHGGDERYQLFQISIDAPNVLQPLTESHPPCFIRGGELHPNNVFLVYGANYDFDAKKAIEPTWVYCHDLRTGERKALAKPQKGAYVVPRLSHDGRYVIYSRKDLRPSGRQIWLVDIEGDHDREIVNLGPEVKAFASWFPDEHKLLVLGEAGTHRKLGVMSVPDGDLQWLLDDPERNIEDAYVPFGSKEIVILEAQEGRTTASLLDPLSGRERRISPASGNLIPLAPFSAQEWVAEFSSSTHPSDVCRFSPSEPHPTVVASLSRVWQQVPLTANDLTPAEDYRWTSADGLPIHGYLYRPATRTRGTVLHIHGGPTEHAQDRIDNEIQLYARSGYVVLAPNFRGSTGYGLLFQESIKREGWGAMEQEDIRAGIEKLIADGLASPGRIGITGTSFGGYSSWWAVTHFPPRLIAAAAPVCGMTDLVVDYDSTRPDLRPLSEEMMGGSPSAIPQKYFERSPVNFVAGIRAALLIVQGGRDPNVTPENVRVVREALDRAGIAHEVLRFEDEGHGILKPANQRRLYLALLEFFGKALGPPPGPG
jgi:dipeptidyl aminopeptidase/acylaminoacyl peptidase